MAKKLGKEEDYQIFHRRAYNYKNLFDGSIDFMRGRSADGKWIEPFDPREPHYNFMTKEASMWSTMWLVPQDVEGLVQLLGGRDKFAAKLDEFFSTPYDNEVICEDCTGVIGQQPARSAGGVLLRLGGAAVEDAGDDAAHPEDDVRQRCERL
jgi:putative alpha-1,2-mannosidase